MPKRTPIFSNAPSTPLRTVTVKKGYDKAWKKLRDRRIQAEPLCRHCQAKNYITPAQEVDHIIPRLLGGKDEWDNTQSLCKPCHQTKTADDMRRIRRGL